MAVGLLVLALLFVLVFRQVLGITQRPSWPPPAGAVTSAGAQAATEAFAARDSPRPHDAAFDFAWSTAATIEPWVEGKTFFPRIFADVEGARSSVHILMFGWREGRVGTEMAALLERKLAEGVEVRVIVDAFGSRPNGAAKEMFSGLADAGAQIVVNDVLPLDRDGLYPDHRHLDWRQDEVGRADHRKLYVIDGEVAWTGGAGIEDHFENGGFHDVMVRVTGGVVRQAQAAFLTSFRGLGGHLPPDLEPYFPAPAAAGTTPVALAQVIPGGFVAASQAIREQIDGARRRLDVMNPYLTDRDMLERIIAAARRGVHVRLVVSETSNNAQASAALEHRYDDLIGAGVEIWELPGHGRPRQGGRRRRRRQLRHREPRLLGALPQLGDHDDRAQRRHRRALREEALRARHRPLASRQAALGRPRRTRELAVGQADLLPVRSPARAAGITETMTGMTTSPTMSGKAPTAASGAMVVLFTLAAGQFLMTLDTSVMNVSIATVAKDVGTTVTGIQGAITAYTLVMAALMITGAKIGAIIGRKRAFAIGCVIYGCGSFITSISQNLPTLLFGWSFLEGVGAALILPAIVALVAGNFPPERRPAAYGLVAAAGAIAVAVGPLVGGFCTTYFSWRWVFASEVVVVLGILLMTRRIADAPVEQRPRLDVVGAVLSALGLGLLVFGVLRSSVWGWIEPKPDGPSWAGLSPTVWLILSGLFVIWLFFRWQERVEARGGEPLVRAEMLRNRQLNGGLMMFFFQFLAQAGLFFVVPLYLSVCLGLSALETGVRLLPLSLTLLIAALGVPRVLPRVSPRLIVRGGLFALLAGTVVLLAALEADSGPEIVLVPMLLIGLGIGALASQLGAITVSAVPDDQSPEVGGIQNTMTNLGASMGTALAGSIMIAAVASSFLSGILGSSAIPTRVKEQAQVELAGGVPFISDADLQAALDDAHVSRRTTDAALEAYGEARIDGLRSALAILALLDLVALFLAQRIPTTPVGRAPE